MQKGHGEVVKTIKFLSGGKFILTGSRDKTIKLWDTSTGGEMRNFVGHQHTINDLDFSDHGTIFSSSADKTAKAWELTSGEVLWQSKEFEGFVTSVSTHPNEPIVAIGSYENRVFIYHLDSGDTLKTLKSNPDKGVGYGVNVRFSPDGQFLAVGEDNRTTRIYDSRTWEQVFEFKKEEGWCGGCGTLSAFSPDGSKLLRLSNNDKLTLYTLKDGSAIFQSDNQLDDIMAVEFHKQGSYFLAATEDSLFIYENDFLKYSWSTAGQINDAVFHPIEKSVLLAVDNEAILYDFEGNELKKYTGIQNQNDSGLDYDLGSYWEHYIAKYIKYNSSQLLDGATLFVGKTGTKARAWNLQKGSIVMEYIGHDKGITAFETINAELIATGGGDGKIIVWERSTGKAIKTIKAHRQPVFDLDLSNDGTKLVSTSWDGVIAIWDTESWERYKYKYHESVSAYQTAFSANDAYVIVGLLDKTLKLLEVETMEYVRDFVGHTDNVTDIFSKDNYFVTSGWDGQVIKWDFRSGLIDQRIKTSAPVFDMDTDPDGNIYFGGANRKINKLDRNWNRKQLLEGHQAEINGVFVNNQFIVSHDVDGITKVWDLNTEEVLYDHIQVGSKDWMVKSPKGYFDATDVAIKYIQFVDGTNIYSPEQFINEFYRPDLVESLLSQNRSTFGSIGEAIGSSPPPSLKLSSYDSERKDVANLYMKATNQGGGIENVSLFLNGKNIGFDEFISKKIKESETEVIYEIDVPMVAGINEFKAIAFSNGGLQSIPATTTVFSDSQSPGSTCHVLAVGINKYQNPKLNLSYAKPDALGFSDQIKEQGGVIFSDIVVHQIVDEEATKNGILQKIQSIKTSISSNDVFIFYFAGHGSVVDGDFYFVATDAVRLYDNSKIQQIGINANELQMALREIKALKQLVIMDACQSGSSVELLAARGAKEEKAIAQLSRASGVHVMAAAGSDQFATEFKDLGHGLFTYVLLKGLSGEADGAPKDGKITVYELKSYVDDQVPELSILHKGTPQYPYTFSRGHDFPILILNN